ncbi:MAG: type II toxin-antitoxin system RatA family toxin [Gammaproteobacteria bacterium]|nr:MAG: type II toxin-antitoxin system RatA family toxin [Gammaproteobacteria bacterium]
MTAIRRSALVPYTAHEMFTLVADIPSYPKFLPWCGGARILSRDEDQMVASIDIAYHGVHRSFTTHNRLQKDKMLEITLVEGPFSHLNGYWQFVPLDERSSRISMDIDFEVSNRVLSLVISPVFTGIANQLVDSFVSRARQLYGPREP